MYGVQRFLSKAFFYSDASQHTESLWFNINLTFFTFFRTNFCRLCIICTNEPFAVPSCSPEPPDTYRLLQLSASFARSLMSCDADSISVNSLPYLTNIAAINTDSATGPSDRSGCLERFTGFTGEAVQIQTVIPVSTSDQRKFVRSEMCRCIMERFVQMFHNSGTSELFLISQMVPAHQE